MSSGRINHNPIPGVFHKCTHENNSIVLGNSNKIVDVFTIKSTNSFQDVMKIKHEITK